MSPVLLAEIERDAAAGEDPWPRFRAWAVRAAAGDLDLRGYLLDAGGSDAGVPTLISPFPIASPAGWREERFASAGVALQAYREAHEADLALTSVRASLAREIEREIARLERLAAGLARDLAREGEAEELQRQGTILLAGLSQARVAGDQAVLPDPFDPAGGDETLTIDPRFSLQENAARLFHRARKSRRGRDTVQRRLAEAEERLPRLRAAAEEAASLPTRAALEELEARLGRAGLVRIVRRARPKKSAPSLTAAPVLPVRAHTSADGMEILIGKGGRENDLLTFKIAAPHDFWMHASGHAGAHVVVRNPQKLKRLPQTTLLQAARLAAFHSKARGAGQVEVIVTQRRQVKKGRNLPPGMVRVQRHDSVQVPPTNPFDEEV
jgi:predicted ribosome quality control (RQC) complex YloA/Tae2 family protein